MALSDSLWVLAGSGRDVAAALLATLGQTVCEAAATAGHRQRRRGGAETLSAGALPLPVH